MGNRGMVTSRDVDGYGDTVPSVDGDDPLLLRRRRRRRLGGGSAMSTNRIRVIRMPPSLSLQALVTAATVMLTLQAGSSSAVGASSSPSTSGPPPHPPSTPPSKKKQASSRWGPFSPSRLRRFLATRCDFSPASSAGDGGEGGGGCAVWVYSGSVSDPFTGRRICDVEGIELTRRLAENVHPYSKSMSKSSGGAAETNRGRLGDLRARDMLFPPKSPSDEGRGSGGGGGWRRKGRRGGGRATKGGVVVKEGDEAGIDVVSSSTSSTTAPQPRRQRPEWDYAGTVLSRRLFCYVDPEHTATGADGGGGVNETPTTTRRRILSRIRIRPGGKERRIDLREAVALYDTATTYVSRDRGRGLIIQTEFPDGRTVTVSAQPSPSASSSPNEEGEMEEDEDEGRPSSSSSLPPSTFDFTAYGRLSRRDGADAAGRLLAPIPSGPSSSSSSSSPPPPPRSKWIQFGPGDGRGDGGKYGARESYSYSNLDAEGAGVGIDAEGGDDEGRRITSLWKDWTRRLGGLTRTRKPPSSAAAPPTVRYTRNGECPPWYGPNRMCTLELVGTRVESLLDAPPLCAGLASHDIPGFAAVHAPIPYRDDSSNFDQEDGIGDDENSGAGLSGANGSGRNARGRGVGPALDALRWFRLGNLAIDEDDSPSFGGRRSITSTVRNIIRRLGAATTRQS